LQLHIQIISRRFKFSNALSFRVRTYCSKQYSAAVRDFGNNYGTGDDGRTLKVISPLYYFVQNNCYNLLRQLKYKTALLLQQ
jgi:hypothetical protein